MDFYYHLLPLLPRLANRLYASYKKKLFSNYQILSTKSRFLAFQSLDILKFSAQSLQTRNLQGGAEFLLQNVENGGCHHIFALFRVICWLKNLQKTLLNWRNLLKLSVILQDVGCFLGIEIGFFSPCSSDCIACA